MMIITGKKVCKFIGGFVLVASILMVLGNIILDYDFSYIAIGVGITSSILLLNLTSNGKKEQI